MLCIQHSTSCPFVERSHQELSISLSRELYTLSTSLFNIPSPGISEQCPGELVILFLAHMFVSYSLSLFGNSGLCWRHHEKQDNAP